MVFNSFEFAIFFIVVYAIYIFSNHFWQNKILLLGSYVFYSFWDARFLSLILISTCLDYFCGLKIKTCSEQKHKKFFLFLSVFGNLSILGIFKYYNFFVASLLGLLQQFDIAIETATLGIVLPVGISFYTFQTMSYTIDIYKDKLEPTKNFLDFALFVSFFPQLVAGPIERAKNLLPQVLKPRQIDIETFYEGVFLFFWGLFQKVLIADNLAKLVDPVFALNTSSQGVLVVIAIYAFAFQIFCDFAGYSNMARGLGKCLGFDIMVNFRLPYFAANPKEFWQRWHISLSTWLRDYLYISLGGNRKGSFLTYRNLLITMVLGGLWHGAAWTFIFWGIYQGLLLIFHRLLSFYLPITIKNKVINSIWSFFKIVIFFQFVCLGWLIFRSTSLEQVYNFLFAIFFQINLGQLPFSILIQFTFYVGIILVVQLFQWYTKNLLFLYHLPYYHKAILYVIGFYLIATMGAESGKEFIYFQF